MYITEIDKSGVPRRKYLSPCLDCKIDRYVQKSKVGKGRCKSCSDIRLSTPERNKKISETLRNKYKTDAEFKKRVLAAKSVKRGNEHWNWKGGITPLTQRTRTTEEANAWKLAVLHRDSYTCRMCLSKENLQAHHINSWAEFPEDRFILENGLTLCSDCHNFYHKYEKECNKNGG